MATPGVLGSASNANTLECPTPPPATIDGKGLFTGLSNRPTDDPPPESESAGPTGIGTGAETQSRAAHGHDTLTDPAEASRCSRAAAGLRARLDRTARAEGAVAYLLSCDPDDLRAIGRAFAPRPGDPVDDALAALGRMTKMQRAAFVLSLAPEPDPCPCAEARTAGSPVPHLHDLRAEAEGWAALANRPELLAFAWAILARLAPRDRAALARRAAA